MLKIVEWKRTNKEKKLESSEEESEVDEEVKSNRIIADSTDKEKKLESSPEESEDDEEIVEWKQPTKRRN